MKFIPPGDVNFISPRGCDVFLLPVGSDVSVPKTRFSPRYVGVTGLAAIVKDHPKYAQEHQMAVIDCLEDPDETLKRKTLDLLYTMTNPVNVEFIADKLLFFLEQGTDSFWRQACFFFFWGGEGFGVGVGKFFVCVFLCALL